VRQQLNGAQLYARAKLLSAVLGQRSHILSFPKMHSVESLESDEARRWSLPTSLSVRFAGVPIYAGVPEDRIIRPVME
jgi:hypothetical protein